MRSRGWLGYTPPGPGIPVAQQAVAEGGDRPELADVGRLARRMWDGMLDSEEIELR